MSQRLRPALWADVSTTRTNPARSHGTTTTLTSGPRA
jgi:hypothetical protein